MNKRKLQFLLIFAALASASVAFAAEYTTSNTFNIGNLTFTPSSKVTVKANSTTGGYTALSSHSSGSRRFGTDQVSSIIYWRDGSALTETVTGNSVSTSHGTPDFTAGSWTSL